MNTTFASQGLRSLFQSMPETTSMEKSFFVKERTAAYTASPSSPNVFSTMRGAAGLSALYSLVSIS